MSTLKSHVACPKHTLHTLLRQTDLDEGSIHTRYIKFRKEYPTGFIGPSALTSLCQRILSKEESEAFVSKIFQLYGHHKAVGWSCRLIGFREVILATENLKCLNNPEKLLRWIFRVYDYKGVGKINVHAMPNMIVQLIKLCTDAKEEEIREDILPIIVRQIGPYERHNISEEEFVFDCLNNEELYALLKQSSSMHMMQY